MAVSSKYAIAALVSFEGTEVAEKNHYHTIPGHRSRKKKEQGNCESFQDVLPVSEAGAAT